MSLSKRLSLSNLTDLCRDLRHYLSAGLTVADAFRHQVKKGPAQLRAMAARIEAELKRGHSLARALQGEAAAFPPLLLALVNVGEAAGMLAEVFAELEKYYTRQMQLRRQFLAQITWPVMQFFLAVFVLAGLIFVLGILNQRQEAGAKPYDPLGLGLSGASGAITFLGVVFGTIAALTGIYFFLTRALKQSARVDRFFLRLPVIGPCMEALAIARFCLGLRLSFETSMSVGEALRLALRATGNAAFAAQIDAVELSIEAGNDLTSTLAGTHLFPEEFFYSLAVGEESGRLTDVLQREGERYYDESGHRLSFIARMCGSFVWAFVGGIMVWAIFRLFSSYLSALG